MRTFQTEEEAREWLNQMQAKYKWVTQDPQTGNWFAIAVGVEAS